MFPYPTPSTSRHSPAASFSDRESLSSGSKPRQRNSRACDQCRKLRSKCIRPSNDSPCTSCTQRQTDCTAEGPEVKRGPPRGYLHALENRLQGAEAILGVIVSLPDSHIQRILNALSMDPEAAEVLGRVNNGAFGPSGRGLRNWLIEAVANSSGGMELKKNTRLGLANDTADPMATRKVNAWQDRLVQMILANSPANMPSTPASMPSSSLPPQSPVGSYHYGQSLPSEQYPSPRPQQSYPYPDRYPPHSNSYY